MKEKIKLLKEGKLSEEEFYKIIEHFPYKDIGDIKLDFHRKFRRGLPEVIYGSGKTTEQLRKIINKFEELSENVLITRINQEKADELTGEFKSLKYYPKGNILTFDRDIKPSLEGKILVLTAGASDENVAEEA
ncbi:MAG: 1-(5-phosphoribosyl)-5-amino-4-imidazole-carboxylate carboxylase, partial [Candidatus Aminicenantes bacterium]|nr:1-(5-phosphoribosyl)-5-amino-4-imidazole-carboxylate carboxylase [Candidatus Aminicenantes bacterium]